MYLIKISPDADKTVGGHRPPLQFIWCDDTRDRRTGCPPPVCLAPHGVFPAARITSRAVSSYLAFSPLPALFSKNRRYRFCDTFRRRTLTNAAPAFFTRHAAVWCSDFPLMSLATHQRSSAITPTLAQRGNP